MRFAKGCPQICDDSESGLYYLRARYYDPTTAQFLSVDPAVASTMSPYAYVGGNPLNGADPSGLFGWSDITNAVSSAASSTTTWVDNNAGTISAVAGTVATVTAFVPGLQGVSVVAGAVSLGAGAIQTGMDLRTGASIGQTALDAAALIPGVTAEAAAIHGLSLARDLRAAEGLSTAWSAFGTGAQLRGFQDAESVAANASREAGAWSSIFGELSSGLSWGGVIGAHADGVQHLACAL